MKKSARALTGLLATIAIGTASSPTQSAAETAAPDRPLSPLLAKTIRPGVTVASDAVFARAMAIKPFKEKDIPRCGATLPVATRIVKIRIKDNFRVKRTERDVISKRSAGGGVRIVSEPPIGPLSTSYDLLLNPSVWDPADSIIAVMVFIKDGRLKFISDDQSITTVELPAGTLSMFMCLDSIKTIPDKPDNDPDDNSPGGGTKFNVATFYVDRSKIQEQKFNIRVIVYHDDNIHALPIIIDPNIKNEG